MPNDIHCPPHMPIVVHRTGGKDADLDNWCGNCGAHLTRASVEEPWTAEYNGADDAA
jgi:hypothetical protein